MCAMLTRSKVALAASLLSACCPGVFAAPQQAPPADKSALAALSKERDPMAWALGRVRLLGDRIGELRDNSAKARAFTSLGDAVCKHDKDFARSIFLRANDALALAARDEEDEQVRNPSKRPRFSPANQIRSQLLAAATQCDAAFAAKLTPAEPPKATTNPDEGSPDINAAYSLLNEKKDEAAQLAAKAMEGQPTDETYRSFSSFLLLLRRQDPPAADGLFLTAVGNLRAQPKPSGYQIMALGNYLFSSFDLTKQPEYADGYMLVTVGGVNVINLQFTRPGNTPQVLRAYLEASLDMLSRPATDTRLQQLDYAAAYLLLPRARESAPDLAPAFELAMKRLDPAVQERMRASAQERLANPPSFARPDEEQESELASSADPAKRQRAAYSLALSALRRNDFARARKFVAEMENNEFRARFSSLIAFGEASKAVEDGRLEEATAATKGLLPGIERGLMFANIAASQIKKGEAKPALTLLDAAQREADEVSTSLRPAFLLAITSVLARADRDAALTLLSQAVIAFNERDTTEKPTDNSVRIISGRNPGAAEASFGAGATGFFMSLMVGGGFTSHPLRVKGIEAYDLDARLLRLFSADTERADAIVSQLREEVRLGPALAALAAAYLDAAQAKPAKAPEKQ
jgi:hypothetical protein